ncbi:alkaline phosphatase domain-containing protein [Phthorimaea operculella]|nr:alkaline phosphatase domain-containing protein [Phthorimaea operculella]
MSLTRCFALLALLLVTTQTSLGRDHSRNRLSGPELAPPHAEEANPAQNLNLQLSASVLPTLLATGLTYCTNAQIADSACSATAYLNGVKGNKGTIGVTSSVPRLNCFAAADQSYHTSSIAAWALEDGRDAGIVTTTRVTHASPAGTFAHTAERDWESDADVAEDCADVPSDARQEDIALQLVHSYPGNQFKVILGGGRGVFLPNTTIDEEGSPGKRLDGRNLIEEWQQVQKESGINAQYVWHRSELLAATSNPPDKLLGLFESGHMKYHLQADPHSEPTLAELTEAAIKVLSRNPKGFFLFVEGGLIDKAHHVNKARMALDETVEFSEAIARAAALLPEKDSLLLVTADHSHVMAFNGYTHRGSDVLGPSDDVDDNGVPYMTLSYTNGPGIRSHSEENIREDITKHNYEDSDFQYESGILLDEDTHGGDDVAVYARGPQHALFSGMAESNTINNNNDPAISNTDSDGLRFGKDGSKTLGLQGRRTGNTSGSPFHFGDLNDDGNDSDTSVLSMASNYSVASQSRKRGQQADDGIGLFHVPTPALKKTRSMLSLPKVEDLAFEMREQPIADLAARINESLEKAAVAEMAQRSSADRLERENADLRSKLDALNGKVHTLSKELAELRKSRGQPEQVVVNASSRSSDEVLLAQIRTMIDGKIAYLESKLLPQEVLRPPHRHETANSVSKNLREGNGTKKTKKSEKKAPPAPDKPLEQVQQNAQQTDQNSEPAWKTVENKKKKKGNTPKARENRQRCRSQFLVLQVRKAGHIASKCDATEPRCPLCADLGQAANHRIGSKNCTPPKRGKKGKAAAEPNSSALNRESGAASSNAGTTNPAQEPMEVYNDSTAS